MIIKKIDDFMKKCRLAMLGTGDIANFHIEAFKKAGFEMKDILNGAEPKISASLFDAYKVQKITQDILFDSN